MEFDTLSVAILAGGKSTRMGTDKGLFPFRGVPLVAYILRQIEGLGLETFIVTNERESYRQFDAPLLPDVLPDIGSLGGIYSACVYAKGAWVLPLACDMPFINLPLFRNMMELANSFHAVVPRLRNGVSEPFRSLFAKSCVLEIRRTIESGERRASAFLTRLKVRYIGEMEIKRFDPSLHSFLNVNSPNDLAFAENAESFS